MICHAAAFQDGTLIEVPCDVPNPFASSGKSSRSILSGTMTVQARQLFCKLNWMRARCTTHRTAMGKTRIGAQGLKKNGGGNEGHENDERIRKGRGAIAAAAACMDKVTGGIG